MESPNVSPRDAKLKRDEDAIALLQDAVPQLEAMFFISHTIGNGTFSSVYFAQTKHTTTINGRRHFAVKHIIPTSHPSRIYMELRCLKMIGGKDNVMGVTMCFREMNHIVIVMPYFPHDSFSDYVGRLSTKDLQDYLRNLLIALRRVHSFGIIHRDVKPANFLYNRKHQRYSLVDFGLAQEVGKLNDKVPSSRGASNYFSPPTIETPHLSSGKTVKRKLAVCSKDDAESDRTKRARHFSPPTSGGVLSSTTNRVNTQLLRRSPRKQCSVAVSPKKENLITPRKGNGAVGQDSPSKHTRNAETLFKTSLRTPNQSAQMRQETLRGLRRSPRKSMSSASNIPLEGLARHLQEGAAFNANAKTPNMRASSSRLDSTVSGESSCSTKPLPQRQRQLQTAAALSPRVSGIVDTRSHNQEKPQSGRRGRVLQVVHTKSGNKLQPVSCHCYGIARVCGVCIGRSNQHAPRAGTPGFRAPEVLLRHPNQGTGKLFTSSEERKALDLSKICDVLRNNAISNESDDKGKTEKCSGCRQNKTCVCLKRDISSFLPMSFEMKPKKEQFQRLTNVSLPSDSEKDEEALKHNLEFLKKEDSLSNSTSKSSKEVSYPSTVYHLLYRFLDPDPETRITAQGALDHTFLRSPL